MAKKSRLLMVGISCLDHIWQIEQFPPQHSRTRAKSYQIQGGGPAATAAVTAARLGAYAELWSIHGNDNNGETARLELERFGVNTSNIRVIANAQTIVSSILVAPDGERYIFPFMGSGLVDTADNLDLSKVANFDCVLTDSRHPIMNEAVLQIAKQAKIPIVADFGTMRDWHLASYVDYLIASEECANELLNLNNLEKNQPERALELLKQFDDQFVGITLGDEGFLYRYKDELRHIPAFPVNVVDTTGAGDVFHGAFAYAIAQHWNIHYCSLFASITAALSCTALGGRAGIPTNSEVKHLLEEQSLKDLNEQQWN